MFRLAHYSIGFNPGVTKPTGRIVEDEGDSLDVSRWVSEVRSQLNGSLLGCCCSYRWYCF